MEIKEFIDKAIKGGYEPYRNTTADLIMEYDCVDEIFLDARAWEAVGKVEWDFFYKCATCGWAEDDCQCATYIKSMDWKIKMHAMIDALIEGKTIEEYIKTL